MDGQLRAVPRCPAVMLMHCFRSFAAPAFSIVTVARKTFTSSQHLRMASSLPKLPVFEAIFSHDPQSTAVIHSVSGRRFLYGQLLQDVVDSRDRLNQAAGGQPIDGQRVAFLVENGYDYVGAIRAGFLIMGSLAE